MFYDVMIVVSAIRSPEELGRKFIKKAPQTLVLRANAREPQRLSHDSKSKTTSSGASSC